jgi:transcriptional/translational regulatory protein YebC/TACO1
VSVPIDATAAAKVEQLNDYLESFDDVQQVFSNEESAG